MFTILPRSTAMQITQPFHGLWLDAHAYAERHWWETIRQADQDVFIAARPATRASVIHDLVVRFVEQHGGENLHASHDLGFFAQTIATDDGAIVVRFKMLDADFRTKNHPSGQQDVLDSQDLTAEMIGQLDLSDVGCKPTVVTCGYQLANDQMSISNVAIVCHHERDVVYVYDVLRGGGMEVVPLPGFEAPPPFDLRSRRRRRDEEGGPEA